MKPEYLEASTVDEAVALLKKYQGRCKLLAGGTDLVVEIKEKRRQPPEFILNIGPIPGLDKVEYRDGLGLSIGALARLSQVERSPLVKENYPILSQAAKTIGSRQIRNLATAVGNICNASPAADLAVPLLVLEASVKIKGPKGERVVKLEEFFRGPGENVLAEDEMVTEIAVPSPPAGSRGVYMKQSPRRAMDIAVVGVAVLAGLDEKNNLVSTYRIGLGAVAPTPVRARRAEALLLGKAPREETILEAARVAQEESQPIDDIRGSAEYRKEIVKVLVKRATKQALGLS